VQQALTKKNRPPSHVLVTGATGFIGAHVVDLLLERGVKVTGTGRSQSKANEMKTRRAKYGDLFSMAIVEDLTAPDVFDDAVQDVDVVIHVASVGLSPSCRSFDVLVADR
jgi:nucleoside-diphosphate-sugar epimerase